jgi:hypothetical protein
MLKCPAFLKVSGSQLDEVTLPPKGGSGHSFT